MVNEEVWEVKVVAYSLMLPLGGQTLHFFFLLMSPFFPCALLMSNSIYFPPLQPSYLLVHECDKGCENTGGSANCSIHLGLLQSFFRLDPNRESMKQIFGIIPILSGRIALQEFTDVI